VNPFREEGPCIGSVGSFEKEDPFIGKGSFTEEDPVIGIISYGEENLFISSFGSFGEDDSFLSNRFLIEEEDLFIGNRSFGGKDPFLNSSIASPIDYTIEDYKRTAS